MNHTSSLPNLARALLVAALCARPASPQRPIVLTLGAAARLAAEKSAGPEAARTRTDQAEARVRQRRADLLPNLSGVASEGERTFNSASFGISFSDPLTGRSLFDPNGQVLGPVRIWDVRGTVRQTIADFSVLERVRAARASVTASSAEASNAAQQAAVAAAMTYIRGLRAEAQLAARIADSTLAEELLRIARDQVTAGVGIALDVTRAQSQLAAMRAQLIAARNARDRARLDLHRALGLPLGTSIELADSLVALPTSGALPSEQEATDRALHTRADLRAADEQINAADRQLSAIKAERLPSLSAFADQGTTGKATDHLLSTYEWGLQVSVPIFDGFRREGRLDEQKSALHELDIRRRDLAQQAAIEVRGALLDLASAREQLTASEERLALGEQELAQARDRFTAGVAGNADVITASLGLNAARTQMVDARAAFQSARVALAHAQGIVTELP
jgi:outer membrane protein TolC